MFTRITLLVLVANLGIPCVVAQQEVSVQLNQGTAKGYRRTGQESSQTFEFVGLPYGKYEQFENPVKLDKWSQDYGDIPRMPCPQVQAMGSLWKEVATSTMQGENLLTLDVYVKNAPNPNPNSNAIRSPVLVYLPGGNSFENANSLYYSPKLLISDANNDFVIVVVNYRVGVFGFLSTGDDVIPGNFGLKDQQLALEWVRDNIEKFGGDKNKVTLMGHDSGAVSVSYHLLNKISKEYFQRAIISGASLYSPWAMQRFEPWRARQQLAEKLRISASSSRDFKEKLKQQSISNILQAQEKLEMGTFVPVLDNYTKNGNLDFKPFFEKDPIEAFENGEVTSDIPIVFGMTKNPGAFELFQTLDDLKKEADPLLSYFQKNLFPATKYGSSLNAVQKHQLDSVIKGVKYLYFKHINASTWSESVLPWMETISDYKYNSGVDMLARKVGKKRPDTTYVYYLEYQGPYTFGKYAFGSQNYKQYAPTLMDDVFYFFNNEEIDRSFKPSPDEFRVYEGYKQKLVAAWSKFIKEGTIKDVQLNPTTWPPFSGNHSALIIINKTEQNGPEFSNRAEYRSEKLEFFSVMVKDLLWTNRVFYEEQETNQHFKSATWGLLAAFLILGLICILLLLYNIKLTKNNQKYNAGFTPVSTHAGNDSVEFKSGV